MSEYTKMSNSSREESPDWLRSFQTPTKSALILSSDSEPPLADSQLSEDEKDIDQGDEVSLLNKTSVEKSADKKLKAEPIHEKKRKRDNHGKSEGKRGDGKIAKQETFEKPIKKQERNHSIWMLSSDSESYPEVSPVRENIYHEELTRQEITQYSDKEKDNVTVRDDKLQETPKRKSPKKRKTEDQIPTKNKNQNSYVKGGNDGDMEVPEEEISAKPDGPYVSSSRLPLVLSEKVQRSKALVECEGESIDLSGDVGAVGRVVISDNPSGNHDMFLDLKGTIYKTTIVPSRTFCVVSFGQSEAKIEAIMNDFIQLKPQSNVYDAETMVEGTLDGFSFDSEDESDNLPKATTNQNDQNEGVEEQHKGKGKGKAEKISAPGRKKSKSAGVKAPKKVKKKTQVTKKTKAKK